ncbi:putative dna replication licensing factor MCM5 [Schistosoma mansoni]|uniref:DNA replication licensing factor MCM5 n=1 Tax=Schistosoma mansoni TaxID=6183 RepID=G4VDE3_SCHMA|nr:putative dna replication licensing factor MCM5 [Schistosoma mansoni]|eukprot:XP_018650537.1 putative dna replication licensing factor MCM5 [Schistosoma mansoni]
MSGFDQGAVYFSDSLFQQTRDQDNSANLQFAKRKFKEFVRQFNDGGFDFKYRDQIKKNYGLKKYFIVVKLRDLNNYDSSLTQELIHRPSDYLPAFEEAVTEVANELVRSNDEESHTESAQVLFEWDSNAVSLRDVHSDEVSRLVKISGIAISSSSIRAKAVRLSLQCRGCRQFLPNLPVKPGLEGFTLPRKCPSAQVGGGQATRCPIDPFFIVPDKCDCVDFQTIKLQETPETVPHGEMPRHVLLYCDRYLCERVVPGNRITVVGVYCIRVTVSNKRAGANERSNAGVRQPYIRVLGLTVDTEGPGRSAFVSGAGEGTGAAATLTENEEEELIALANSPDIYERLARSIAPSIYGSTDIKKAIACLLFGGSRKRLPDGLMRRGDINMLMLGDPGTAKSQLLKFVERCSPVGIYTSGKGSSAAGLTASVTRDPNTRNFIMEGGAMVLADGGVVCIDEFDKMREDDRVAIHEAMEQQTISIAKAGITTTLNSRCSVLAAANSVYGRWDDTKGEDNIDFMPTILSRFDMIFVIRDEHDSQRDATLAKHVMQVHLHGNDPAGINAMDTGSSDEIPLSTLRRFIAFARERCGPRLSEQAAEKLSNQYVLMRSGSTRYEQETGKRCAIPITVRQLEAIIRISESLAKMRLAAFATETDVEEALRLFHVSTLEAAMSGSLEGAEGFTTQEEHELVLRLEKQLKKRFVIGSQVSEYAIIQDFTRQGFSERAVTKVLHYMIRRGEVQYRMQRRILYRIK